VAIERKSTGRVTLDDVAARAEVSRMTVSRVLSRPGDVAPATRTRVEAAITALGYQPDLGAREMAAGSSSIVAVVLPALDNPFFARTARGLAARLHQAGGHMLLSEGGYTPEAEEAAVRLLLSRRPRAIVLMGVDHTDQTRAMLRASGVRTIETWDLTPDPIDVCIGFSSYQAGFAVGEHFATTGRRRIIGCGTNLPRNRARLKGLEAAAAQHQIACETLVGDQPAAGLIQHGREMFTRALAKTPRADALFFISDTYALGALLEAARQGVRVPDDVAIVGFNDHDLASQWDPGLSTVTVPDTSMGAHAAARVLDPDAVAAPVVDLGFTLTLRGSSPP
jgi:LacI family gluconate utilization system Gnt-I transcriptional repressor